MQHEPLEDETKAEKAATRPRKAFQMRGGRLEVFGRSFPLPAHPWARAALGFVLIIGGVLGFLPILGFWMVPIGLLILSIDLALVRRWRRRTALRWNGRRRRPRPPA